MEQLSASMGVWCAQFSNLDKLHAQRSTFRATAPARDCSSVAIADYLAVALRIRSTSAIAWGF